MTESIRVGTAVPCRPTLKIGREGTRAPTPRGGGFAAGAYFSSEAFAEETVWDEESGKEETRVVLRFVPRLAPVKAGIFPLLKNKPELVAKAREVQKLLQPLMKVAYDEAGSIGKRYRRIDEEGTPFGITVDFETLEGVKAASTSASGAVIEAGQKETVTLRHRDSMKQERIAIADLAGYLLGKIA